MNLKNEIRSIKDYLLFACIAIPILMILISIAGRTVWPHEMVWLNDAACFSLVYMCFTAAMVLFERDEHINMVYIIEKLSPKSQRFLVVSRNLASSLLFAIILPHGIQQAIRMGGRITEASTPVPYIFLLFPGLVFAAYIAISGFVKFLRDIGSLLRGQ